MGQTGPVSLSHIGAKRSLSHAKKASSIKFVLFEVCPLSGGHPVIPHEP